MRGGNRAAFNTLIGICAGLLLAACSTPPPSESPRVDSQAPRPIAAPAAAPEAPEHAASVSYPRNGDSDDYLCNFAAPGDPRTPAACARLRGPQAVPQPVPRYGDSDDFVCHHGAPADPRTLQACQRLRPPPEP